MASRPAKTSGQRRDRTVSHVEDIMSTYELRKPASEGRPRLRAPGTLGSQRSPASANRTVARAVAELAPDCSLRATAAEGTQAPQNTPRSVRPYVFNPLRGLRHLPDIDISDIDWTPLPESSGQRRDELGQPGAEQGRQSTATTAERFTTSKRRRKPSQ